ncbi:helix-turn-helix domain-containing protein [Nisaea sp.]|uniref:helix-turn-helix domain-containing protein n=1 Tax=Nisaea sp. TaxID=2024842 RepID=UPI003B52CC54
MSDAVTLGGDAAAVQPVPNAVFSVDSVLGKERYDLWRESISCIFEVDGDRESRRSEAFKAEIDATMFGPIMLARTQTLQQDWRRSASVMARDGMDHYMIQLFEHGQMQWEDGTGLRELPEDGLIVFDLAQEMNSRTNDFRNLSLIIPRDMMDGVLKPQCDQHMRVLTKDEPMVNLLRDHMMSLKALSHRMNLSQAIEIAPATAGLAAACLNAAVDQENPNQSSGVAMAQLTMIRRFIESNLSEPDLSAEWIAKRVGASRSKLYKLFDAFGGVGAYIRDRRLRRALLALTDETAHYRPIYDIALASGYTSDAAFSRAFRAKYGIAPRDVRNNRAQLNALGDPGAGEGVDRRYERWLHHLSV